MNDVVNVEENQLFFREWAVVSKRFIKKQQLTLQKQIDEKVEAAKGTAYQQIGDSILADLHCAKRGAIEVLLENVHTQEMISVAFNPKLDAQENAELFYKKAKKAKRSLAIIEENCIRTQQRADSATEILHAITALLESIDPITDGTREEIRNRLVALDIIKKMSVTPGQATKQHEEPHPYRHVTLEGWDIYIGKNDTQNDELSTRFAKPSDVWFHVAAHAGSHLIIRRPKNTPLPPKHILETVASFSVWYSKVKHTSFAEVHYTEARFVHKRRKSPPGEVMLDHYKTLRVAPKNPQDFFKDNPSLKDD